MAGHDDDDGRYYVDLDDVIIHDDGTVHLDNDEHEHHFHLVDDDDNDSCRHDDNVAAFFANYRRRFLDHLDDNIYGRGPGS
jgi:hypothetical protein